MLEHGMGLFFCSIVPYGQHRIGTKEVKPKLRATAAFFRPPPSVTSLRCRVIPGSSIHRLRQPQPDIARQPAPHCTYLSPEPMR